MSVPNCVSRNIHRAAWSTIFRNAFVILNISVLFIFCEQKSTNLQVKDTCFCFDVTMVHQMWELARNLIGNFSENESWVKLSTNFNQSERLLLLSGYWTMNLIFCMQRFLFCERPPFGLQVFVVFANRLWWWGWDDSWVFTFNAVYNEWNFC